jgi:8-oxo-dGTP pyrophosphatase MutT (NUDIX family)
MDLRTALLRHAPADARESADLQRIVRFVDLERDPFDRRNPRAHLTGSAFVVSEDGASVLLLHHRKLNRWLQPGGHADPGEDAGERVALREAREETGIQVEIEAPLRAIEYFFVRRGVRYHKTVHFFLMRPTGGALDEHDAEFDEARWVQLEEARELLTYPTERLVVEEAAHLLHQRPADRRASA